MLPDVSERAFKRFDLLIKEFELFRRAYESHLKPHEQLHINYIQLYNVAVSYFLDVERYKAFHFVEPGTARINDAKKSAFTAKWLIYTKPIYVHNDFTLAEDDVASFEYDDMGLVVNELFAIFVAECFMALNLSDERFHELLYILRYHDPNEYMLMPLFQTIVDHARGAKLTLGS